jgi:hypothetical protein
MLRELNVVEQRYRAVLEVLSGIPVIEIELERTVTASGNISLGDHLIGAGLPLAGQRVTLRLGGPVAHIVADGIRVRTVTSSFAARDDSPERSFGGTG